MGASMIAASPQDEQNIFRRFFEASLASSSKPKPKPLASVTVETGLYDDDVDIGEREKRLFLRFFVEQTNQAVPLPAELERPLAVPNKGVKPASTKTGDTKSFEETGSLETAESVTIDKDRRGLFQRVSQGLSRTRQGFAKSLATMLLGKKRIDAELLEEIETQLLMADVGVSATQRIIDYLTDQVDRDQLTDSQVLYDVLQQQLRDILHTQQSNPFDPAAHELSASTPLSLTAKPYVILVVGVNGVGKTTTIGKLAKRLQAQGQKVMLAAGDTFRAAAVEQLQEWGARNAIPVIAQQTGADSASVIYDAVLSAQARGIDVLIADTAGRLHTKDNLMEELKKVNRVIAKTDATAPHEVMLVLDAGTGQNALNQAEQFGRFVNLTGITLTKLDGTAKGGIVFALADKLHLPIRYIGVGEKIDDLKPFVANDFVNALFSSDAIH